MWFVVPPGRRKVGAGPDSFPPIARSREDRAPGRNREEGYGVQDTGRAGARAGARARRRRTELYERRCSGFPVPVLLPPPLPDLPFVRPMALRTPLALTA